jgi:hypothetical protein
MEATALAPMRERPDATAEWTNRLVTRAGG